MLPNFEILQLSVGADVNRQSSARHNKMPLDNSPTRPSFQDCSNFHFLDLKILNTIFNKNDFIHNQTIFFAYFAANSLMRS